MTSTSNAYVGDNRMQERERTSTSDLDGGSILKCKLYEIVTLETIVMTGYLNANI